MTKGESDKVVARLRQHDDARQLIEYDRHRPDKFVSGVFWSSYGVIPTNEIIVVAKTRDMVFAAAEESCLIHPGMIDMIFGMDMSDRELCNRLAQKLWLLVEQYIPKQ